MSEWYFEADGKQHGPVAQNEIVEKLSRGELSRDSLVWKGGQKNWKPISEFEEFLLDIKSPPPLPKSIIFSRNAGLFKLLTGRFVAKLIDCQFAFGFGAIVAYFISPEKFIYSFLIVLASGIAVLYGFDVLGKANSPGRLVLGIKLEPVPGGDANYTKRFFLMLFKGNGGFVPFLSLIFQVISLFKVKKQGVADWDIGRFSVSAGSGVRIFFGLILFILFSSVFAIFGNPDYYKNASREDGVNRTSTPSAVFDSASPSPQTSVEKKSGVALNYPVRNLDSNVESTQIVRVLNVLLPEGWSVSSKTNVLPGNVQHQIYLFEYKDAKIGVYAGGLGGEAFITRATRGFYELLPMDRDFEKRTKALKRNYDNMPGFADGGGYQQVSYAVHSSFGSDRTHIASARKGSDLYYYLEILYHQEKMSHDELKYVCDGAKIILKAVDFPYLANLTNQGVFNYCK